MNILNPSLEVPPLLVVVMVVGDETLLGLGVMCEVVCTVRTQSGS